MRLKIFKYENVTSTNDIAMKLIKLDKMKSGCVLTNLQTNGRGNYGRKWISLKGNLFVSIFFPLRKSYPAFSEFTVINPLIISKIIKKISKEKKINIKFPNDIFINGKKVCGILQEIISLKKREFIIIGIGVNIISNPHIDKKYKATNILKETKRKIKVEKFVKDIIFNYEKFLTNLNNYNYQNFKKKAEAISIS